jgi:nitroreductase
VRKLVEAAIWAPSSCNRQTCRFLILRDEDERTIVGKAVVGGAGFAEKAPVHILALVDARPYHLPHERHLPFVDSAASIQNMLLLAHAMGLGACWINWTVDPNAEKKIRAMFRIPPYLLIVALVAVGYPDFISPPPPRKRLEDVLFSPDGRSFSL